MRLDVLLYTFPTPAYADVLHAFAFPYTVVQEAAGAGTIFVDVLWAMVVLVGCSMSLGGCMVAYRHFKAGGGGAPMYLPVQAAVRPARFLREPGLSYAVFELLPTRCITQQLDASYAHIILF